MPLLAAAAAAQEEMSKSNIPVNTGAAFADNR